MTPLYIIRRSLAWERRIIHNAAPCCVRPLAIGAVELIRQLALFEGEYLDCTKLSQPARHDKAVLRATSCCWCCRANQATCTIQQVA